METILENMGYELENEEVEDLRRHLPVDGELVVNAFRETELL